MSVKCCGVCACEMVADADACPRCGGVSSFAAPIGSAVIPRRIRTDLYTTAEKAIAAAIEAVEVTGCHELLTDAVNLLSQAKSKVAARTSTTTTSSGISGRTFTAG